MRAEAGPVRSRPWAQDFGRGNSVRLSVYLPVTRLPHVNWDVPPARGSLTPREREVVTEVIAGRSNREIAAHCGISVQTVKNHLTSAFLKLGVANRLQLVLRLIGGDTR